MAEVALDPGLSSSAAYSRLPRSRGSGLLLLVASCVVTSGDSCFMNTGELKAFCSAWAPTTASGLCAYSCAQKQESVAF